MDTLLDFVGQVNFDIQHCFIQSEQEYQEAFYQNNIWRIELDDLLNPAFNSISDMDYGFSTSSILNGNGFATSVTIDILGTFRNNPPDIGALEQN